MHRRKRACGQIRSILPDACIALLFKKKQKYSLVIVGYKNGSKMQDYICGGDRMKNLVRAQKITNGRGSIKYITKDSKGEILASYSTQTLQEWEILFDYNQQKFNEEKEKGGWIPSRKNAKGEEAQCIEARMYVVAFPNEMANYPCKYNGQIINNDMELAKAIANDWRNTYGTDCYVAIHWNKSHTNFHAHILVSERIKKESQEVKRAKRNRYYDANGRECKKADAVRIIHKGDVIRGQNELYESRKLDFHSEDTLNRIKEHYSKTLGTELYKEDGLHIPQQHLPRINERTSDEVLEVYERTRSYNESVKEFNKIVDILKENHHEDILEDDIKPIVVECKRQRRYRKRYLEESIVHLRETFKYALASFKSLLNVFRVRKNELDNVKSKYNAIDTNIKGYQDNIKLQESVLKTQVKWSDFKQKKYINGLISDYKKNISSLELEKSGLSDSKQKLEVKVDSLRKELENRLNGITRRIDHYRYECGEYPKTIEDITKFERQEQMIKQEQDKMSKQANTPQPTVDYKRVHKQHKSNAAKLHEYEK